MLSLQTVYPDTLELLKSLMQVPALGDMRLVGGTALALQYGHRRSVDLDFFGTIAGNIEELTEMLREYVGELTQLSASRTIRVYNIRNTKVDMVNYGYPWIDDAVIEDHLRLASPKDIAAMKVNAVIGRGTKKDFVDIYYLLRHFSFEELMRFYLEKYTDGSEYRALLSMTYFGDADPQPMPYMFEYVRWDTIKNCICKEVEQYNQQYG
ncbi:MAG: nucleotidyl transferase AbiEii/AbiGii toxin family protein [Prevotella sp.]|nr:nucleotidyl transferase AbiEii/AbiGii toxin family protein [Prevotella sp.]